MTLQQLLTASTRYEQIARRAQLSYTVPTSLDELEIIERIPGTSVTDFGALAALLTADQRALEEREIERLVRLLSTCWATLDDVLHTLQSDLYEVKPERGRSPDAIRLHLLETDLMHLSAFGIPWRSLDHTRIDEQEAGVRRQFLAQLQTLPRNKAFTPHRKSGFSWNPHFAARSSAWHALNHAWELQDRVRDTKSQDDKV